MENQLALAVRNALPQLSGNITYNEAANLFLTQGYVSQAGNMYQEGVRLSRRMAVKFSIGHGYYHTFLNGIQVYMWDGGKPKMVAHRCYSNFWWSESEAQRELKSVVKSFLLNESKLQGYHGITEAGFNQMTDELVGETRETTALIGSQTIPNSTLCIER